jgi:glycosyltransferase involved in cell wall biosynthesis
LYSTPPVTFSKCIKFIKKRDNSISYLLLKDIFPQNALDLGILKKTGVLWLIYFYFRFKEKQLYKYSDFIGCMSPANKKYILENNIIDQKKVEVNPNSEYIIKKHVEIDRSEIFRNFDIPLNKMIFIYGGNIGKPQGVDFIIECIKDNEKRERAHFVIVGSGTEYGKLKNQIDINKFKNTTLIYSLHRYEYEMLLQASDVGMVFLDYKFTIPNFPSRILSYMKFSKPIIMAVDGNTDLGIIARQSGFGDYVKSDNVESFNILVNKFINEYDLVDMGKKSNRFYIENYNIDITYNKIISKLED